MGGSTGGGHTDAGAPVGGGRRRGRRGWAGSRRLGRRQQGWGTTGAGGETAGCHSHRRERGGVREGKGEDKGGGTHTNYCYSMIVGQIIYKTCYILGGHNYRELLTMGTYQVETSPPVETMETPITAVRSASDGHRKRWEPFAKNRPPGPLPILVIFQKPPRPPHPAGRTVGPVPHM
jgi:hypothetical protein